MPRRLQTRSLPRGDNDDAVYVSSAGSSAMLRPSRWGPPAEATSPHDRAQWQAEQLVAWTSGRMVLRIALIADEQMLDIRRGKARLDIFGCDTTRIQELMIVRGLEIRR